MGERHSDILTANPGADKSCDDNFQHVFLPFFFFLFGRSRNAPTEYFFVPSIIRQVPAFVSKAPTIREGEEVAANEEKKNKNLQEKICKPLIAVAALRCKRLRTRSAASGDGTNTTSAAANDLHDNGEHTSLLLLLVAH